MNEFHKAIGIAPKEFHCYMSESGENVIVLSGLMMPYGRIDAMTESIQSKSDIIANSMKAMKTRSVKELNVFEQTRIPDKAVTSSENNVMSALEKLKAKRLTK